MVQIFRSDNVRRNVTCRLRILFAPVAHPTPVVKAIALRVVGNLIFQGGAAGKACLAVALYFHGASFPGSDALAAPYRNQSRVAIGVHVEAVLARSHYGERQVGCINFVSFAVI